MGYRVGQECVCMCVHIRNLCVVLISIPECSSHLELWMISEYHPHGSLFDYLTIQVLTPVQVIRFARTIASGLAFLHADLRTNETQKPSIAHRDLKSRNILVKTDLTCCIADFGLAVRHDTVEHLIDIAPNSKQGLFALNSLFVNMAGWFVTNNCNRHSNCWCSSSC